MARGERWESYNQLARALTAYNEAVRMDTSYGPAYLGLGRLRERMGHFSEAERVYGKAIRLRGVSAQALAHRAKLRDRLGRRQAAIEDMHASLERDPQQLDSAVTLASWYVEGQAWPAALAMWRHVLSLHRRAGRTAEAQQAKIKVQALAMLSSNLDPVTAGGAEASWVRQALARIGRRGG